MTAFSILDTNVLVRFLVGDHATQKHRAQEWFEEAERGKRTIIVTALVIAETSFVLESFYKLDRSAIAHALEIFVTQPWLHIEHQDVLIALWPFYQKGFHFVDSYLRSWISAYGGELLTFDKGLLKSL